MSKPPPDTTTSIPDPKKNREAPETLASVAPGTPAGAGDAEPTTSRPERVDQTHFNPGITNRKFDEIPESLLPQERDLSSLKWFQLNKIFQAASSWQMRAHVREPCLATAVFRPMGKGEAIRGVCRDMTATGTWLALGEDGLHDRTCGVERGTGGLLEIALREGRAPVAVAMYVRVAWVLEYGMGLTIVAREGLAPSEEAWYRSQRSDTSSEIWVRRSNGSLQGGWTVHPRYAPLPPSIHRLCAERDQQQLTVVCSKKDDGGRLIYKVYSFRDLQAIQAMAKKGEESS